MVKGTSKRVVVVKSPDPKIFEQAIFIVREDFFGRRSGTDALKEAQEVADDYIRRAISKPRRLLRGKSLILWLSGGSVFAGLLVLAIWHFSSHPL